MKYRPWGLLDWALDLSEQKEWFFIGTLGTEVRSLAAWKGLLARASKFEYKILEIHDRPSRFTIAANKLLEVRNKEFVDNGGQTNHIIKGLGLLDEYYKVDELSVMFANSGESVILDITSLPKRYFFPILRRLVKNTKIQNLVITYTLPEDYAKDGPLSEGAGNWTHIPGFLPTSTGKSEFLIAGAGFATQNLQNHVKSITRNDVKLLIPFPATLDATRQAWQAIYQLQGEQSAKKFSNFRVPANDISSAFDRIISLNRNTVADAAFAPFGPKPISAAMCIFASARGSAVYYPQPIAYNPNYSTGIAKCEGKDAIYAYWIRHHGKMLYEVPN